MSAYPLLASARLLFVSMSELRLSQGITPLAMPQREALLRQLADFKAQARKNYVSDSAIEKAHYFMCAAIDEAYYAVTKNTGKIMPSLLNQYHQDTHGGERFFTLLDTYQESPQESIELLLIGLQCLNLGFKGKYALQEQGTEYLLMRRKQLFALVERVTRLQVSDAGGGYPKKTVRRFLSFPYLALSVFLMVGSIYGGLQYSIATELQVLQQHVNQLTTEE